MHYWISLFVAVFGSFSFPENLSPSDIETIRRIQARAQQEKMEKEFREPKKPEVQKGRAVLGLESAPITIVAYSDFQCPYCKNGFQAVEEVRRKYGKKVRFMFKHLPLPMHPLAMPAARRFEAIALQDSRKAYRFHDEVFKNQQGLSSGGESFLDHLAQKVGANLERMKKALESDRITKNIQSDMDEAQRFGITGTPGFIVAGVGLYGAYPAEAFSAIIDRKLKEKKKQK